MSWPAHTWVPDELVTDSELNTYVRDPLTDLSAHTHNGVAGQGSANIVPTSVTMGGPLYLKKGTDITAVSSITLPTDGNYFVVTGSTTITAISAAQAGTVIYLRFNSALTVQHNSSSLILQSGGNLTTTAGSVLVLLSEGSGNWREITRWVGGTIPKGYLWVPFTGISGAASRDNVEGNGALIQIGTGAADGTAYARFRVPSDYAALISAVICYQLTSGGSGRNERYRVDADIASDGALYNAGSSPSLGPGNLTGLNVGVNHELDISTLIGAMTAGQRVSVAFTNLASSTTGGGQQDPLYVEGIALHYAV